MADLRKEGITAIIDLNQNLEEMNEAQKADLTYVADSRLEIPDEFEPISVDQLRYVTLRIHQLISQGHYVYLHCSYSIGRSPTLAAAYLICSGKEMNKAMRLVRDVRPKAWSGDDQNYAAFLGEYEKTCRGSCTSE